MQKQRELLCVWGMLFCLQVLFLSFISPATAKSINPDAIGMDIRVAGYSVYAKNWGTGSVQDGETFPTPHPINETNNPVGLSFSELNDRMSGVASDLCSRLINPATSMLISGPTGNLTLVSLGIWGSGSAQIAGTVSCEWMLKPEVAAANPNAPKTGTIEIAGGGVSVVGNCQMGYMADPTNDPQGNVLQYRCVPKAGFSSANLGRGSSCSLRVEDSPLCSSPNPVHFGTGNKTMEEVDYTGSGVMPLKWVRYYNGFPDPLSTRRLTAIDLAKFEFLVKVERPLGEKWLHNYEGTIVVGKDSDGLEHVVVYRPTGRIYVFEQNTAGKWVASQGLALDEQLIAQKNADGSYRGWLWTNADDTVESYDAQGLLLSVTSKEGFLTRLSYVDASGAIYPVGAPACVLPSGSPTAAATVPVNGLQCVTDPQGRQLNFQYNNNGQIQRVIDPTGQFTEYTYVEKRFNIGKTAIVKNGVTTELSIISQFLALSQLTRPDKSARQYLYSENGHVPATVIDSGAWVITGIQDNPNTAASAPWVRFSTYDYDENFKVTQESLAGGVESYLFNHPYNTGPNQVTSSVYGPNGDNLRQRFANIVTAGNSGQIKMTTDRLGGQFTYDASGNVQTYTEPRFVPGGISNRVSTFMYDTQNRLTELWEGRDDSGNSDSTTRHRTMSWNATTHLPSQIVEDISFSQADGTPVPQGQRITTLSYDSQNHLTQKSVQGIDKTTNTVLDTRTWKYAYNGALSQLSQVQIVDGSTTQTLQSLAYYTADSANSKTGDLKSITNALGHITTFDNYDAAGRLLQSTDPNGVITQLSYDSRGHVSTHSISGRNTSYTWNGLGQLEKVVLPDNSSLSYSYDDARRLTQIQDASGNLLRMAYDNASRLIAMDRVNAQSEVVWRREWAYDSYDNIVQVRNVRGAAPTIALNQWNPVVQSSAAKTESWADSLIRLREVSPMASLLPNMELIQTTQALLKGERS